MSSELLSALQTTALALLMVYITWLNNRTKRPEPITPKGKREHETKAILSMVKPEKDEQEVVLDFVRKYQQALADSQRQPSEEMIKRMEVGSRSK